jgi:hypothetical protein
LIGMKSLEEAEKLYEVEDGNADVVAWDGIE